MALDRIKINVDLDIPIFWFFGIWLILGGIVSVAIYCTSIQEELILRIAEAAKFFLLVAGAGFVAVTVYCHWKTLFLNVKQTEYQIDSEKKRFALELVRRWDSDNMAKKRYYYRDIRSLRRNKSDGDIIDLINEDPNQRNSILDIANYFEDVQQSIKNDIADEEILEYSLKPLLQSIKKTYEPWFDDLKEADPEDYDQFKPFLELLHKWR